MIQSRRGRNWIGQNFSTVDHNFEVVSYFTNLGYSFAHNVYERVEIRKRIIAMNKTSIAVAL